MKNIWICEICGGKTEYEQDTRFENSCGEMVCSDCIEAETVDVIASGYEWTCPKCKNFNNEIQSLEHVKCKECETVFNTQPPEHCYG